MTSGASAGAEGRLARDGHSASGVLGGSTASAPAPALDGVPPHRRLTFRWRAEDVLADLWIRVKDGDDRARGLFHRHYSYRRYADGRNPRQFVGPGEHIVLLTVDCRALFIWRKFIDASGQQGVNCSVFRNESPHLSSDLIRGACIIAWQRWPGERLYTYVNPRRIRSTNPGYCFLAAGWQRCGTTKGQLAILQRLPEDDPDGDALRAAFAMTGGWR